jgi:hypothetical protein
VAAALKAYAATVSGLMFFHGGPDLGLRAETADFSVVAVFGTVSSYRAYAADPAHHAIIDDLIAAAADTRTASQIGVSL